MNLLVKANPADYKPEWKRIEADNGAAYAVDLKSIANFNDGTEMKVCIVDNNACAIMPGTWNPTIFHFDCHGHYIDVYGGGGLRMAPPRSVVGKMAALACVDAKDVKSDSARNKDSVGNTILTPNEHDEAARLL